jgi:hypothetical protein
LKGINSAEKKKNRWKMTDDRVKAKNMPISSL